MITVDNILDARRLSTPFTATEITNFSKAIKDGLYEKDEDVKRVIDRAINMINNVKMHKVEISHFGKSNKKRWAKHVEDVDMGQSNGFAFKGEFLQAGENRLPENAVIINIGWTGSYKNGSYDAELATVDEKGEITEHGTFDFKRQIETLKEKAQELLQIQKEKLQKQEKPAPKKTPKPAAKKPRGKVYVGAKVKGKKGEGEITDIITKSTGYVEVTYIDGSKSKEMAFNLKDFNGDTLRKKPGGDSSGKSRGEKKREKDRKAMEAFNALPMVTKIKHRLLWINGITPGDRNSLSYQIVAELLSSIFLEAKNVGNARIADIAKKGDRFMNLTEKQAFALANFADKHGIDFEGNITETKKPSTPKPAAKTKTPVKNKTESKTPAKKKTTRKPAAVRDKDLVRYFDDEMRIIKRFANMLAKEKTIKSWGLAHKFMQKLLAEKRVHPNSKLADLVSYIAGKTEKVFDHHVQKATPGQKIVVDIKEDKQREKILKLAKGTAVYPSVRLMKRYIGMQGETPGMAKISSLLKAIESAIRRKTVHRDDPFGKELEQVRDTLKKAAQGERIPAQNIGLGNINGLSGTMDYLGCPCEKK